MLKESHQPSQGKKEKKPQVLKLILGIAQQTPVYFFQTTHCDCAIRLFGLSEDTASKVTLAEVELNGALLSGVGLRERG
jgi:hypothetical protein